MTEEKVKKKYKNEDRLWIFITLGIVMYGIFLGMKINGIFDWTAKYGIESISCTESYNGMLVLDDNLKTTWGLLEDTHCLGEVFDIKFRTSKEISGFKIVNSTEAEAAEINIYYSIDGEEYILCDATLTQEGDEYTYSFGKTIEMQWLRLEYASSEIGEWPITEIGIYD